jgi:hypothetical protein
MKDSQSQANPVMSAHGDSLEELWMLNLKIFKTGGAIT